MSKRVLLVDDDLALCELLAQYLQAEGFDVCSVNSGSGAIEHLAKAECDVMVLDIMMPGMTGLEVLQRVRADNAIPIIMLTGRGDDIDRIIGLEMGADDYLGKPCNPRELAARLRAVTRRAQPGAAGYGAAEAVITLNNITMNSSTLAVTFNGEPASLTGAEFNVLLVLMKSAGQALSKQNLTREALHREFTQYDRSIDVHVSRIRHKLAESGLSDIIRSVRGVGYQMLLLENDAL
ncbi:response regulator transcription factor [Marinagarivorans cellulosilyticus]|uniref:Two-component system, OmpR family, response regulator n=1 Tax=Marinagarivorans cellulosilyticus TaxID=2721545 RepID=A0AAN1WF79_9GAMM|nr:response regulator transcription factor [Marinagarivorans cellulosilyticus]BCD96507.1 two-component system, OmpR family, response regulator [Marinagarivorans cellulosilyticus]